MAEELHNWSIGFAGFKCFGTEPQGLDAIYPLNFLIGRNNAGKSALLEGVARASCRPPSLRDADKSDDPRMVISVKVTESLSKELAETRKIPPSVLRWLLGRRIAFTVRENDPVRFLKESLSDTPPSYASHLDDSCALLWNLFPIRQRTYKGISEARDIRPEPLEELEVTSNGEGATGMIARFLNDTDMNSSLVRAKLLHDLNEICRPDAGFQEILTKREKKSNLWEIYLQEETKGSIRLSASGSGLKTVILVLIYIHLLPVVGKNKLAEYVFGIEEPENNLHPALQRKLFSFLRRQTTEHGLMVFVATHSPVILDMFANDDDARIHRVTQVGGRAQVTSASEYTHLVAVLDDLDVRASDLLQANGLVWVEGPSDRVYVNKWIELWSEGALEEGVHFQCVFYGGKLRRYLSGDVRAVESLVQVFLVNRNVIVIQDSDKSSLADSIDHTKQRIADEVTRNGGMSWITAGREIENYLPQGALDGFLKPSKSTVRLAAFRKVETYLADRDAEKLKLYKRSKVDFAEEIAPCLDKPSLERQLDLSERLKEVCHRIRQWNGIEVSGSKS